MQINKTRMDNTKFSQWLDRNPFYLSIFGGLMAFGVYFSMYAFRKPFSAASYEDLSFGGIDYKVILVIAQVIGYAISKFIGIKVVSELPAAKRALTLIGLILIAEIALLGFAIIPAPYNIIMMFLNGLPLGMVWGLVFAYLEGRRTSEILGSILCASFIVSSGMVKSVGKWLMLNHYANEFYMPVLTGLIFLPLLLVCMWGLVSLPPPNADDIQSRTKREPMNKAARKELFAHYAPGFVTLIILYVFLTALRDFRDNFAAEIWIEAGQGANSDIFALSELPIGIVVLIAMCSLAFFKNNKSAFIANMCMIAFGLILTGVSSLLFANGLINAVYWMILLGGGLYIAYTPFNGILFDRLIAATGKIGTAGFLIYVADSSGYAGSVALLLIKNFSDIQLRWSQFLTNISIFTAISGLVLLIFATIYFLRKFAKE